MKFFFDILIVFYVNFFLLFLIRKSSKFLLISSLCLNYQKFELLREYKENPRKTGVRAELMFLFIIAIKKITVVNLLRKRIVLNKLQSKK